jgi:hypothetical protein
LFGIANPASPASPELIAETTIAVLTASGNGSGASSPVAA